jgi:hypothetical protein
MENFILDGSLEVSCVKGENHRSDLCWLYLAMVAHYLSPC